MPVADRGALPALQLQDGAGPALDADVELVVEAVAVAPRLGEAGRAVVGEPGADIVGELTVEEPSEFGGQVNWH